MIRLIDKFKDLPEEKDFDLEWPKYCDKDK